MAATVKVIPPKEKAPEISYAAQIRKYTEEIGQHDGWELVDIYADEAVTGTRMDKREDFNRMMADCRKGRIDKVLVKSVSRFARNTKDCLATQQESISTSQNQRISYKRRMERGEFITRKAPYGGEEFHTVQALIHDKTAGHAPPKDRPAR